METKKQKHYAFYVTLFAALLPTLVFAALKVCGVLSWSWFWVFTPVWFPCGALLVLFVAAMVFALIASQKNKRHD